MLIADVRTPGGDVHGKDKHHDACTALFRRFRGPVIVLALISVTEVVYFLQIEPGPPARADAIVHAPAAFRRRGVYVSPQELEVA